jgi:lipopolysaccharide transport system permease protein
MAGKLMESETTIIRPVLRATNFDLRELARYRHLLWSMICKSVQLEFDQLSLGVFWALSRPLSMVFIFSFIKNRSGANMHVDLAYPLYLYSGIILWFHFRDAAMDTAKSVMKDAGLMKRIYYPRLITPIVPGCAKLYSFAVSFLPMIVMMAWYGIYPGWRLTLLPLVLVQCTLLILGLGLIFSCLILLKPDFEKFLNLCLYLGLFVSPVIFSPEMIPQDARMIYFINPMAGTLLAFRSCLFNEFPFPLWQFMYSVIFTLLVFFVGLKMYRRAEIYFADKL